MPRSNPTGMPFVEFSEEIPKSQFRPYPQRVNMAILRKGNLGPYHCHGCFHCCLGFMFSNGIIGALNNPNQFILGAIRSLLALAPAFVLHEIAHKFMAKRYGCWAEFRADPSGLRFGLILSALTGIVFMAPGAVMVLGRTTTAQFGRIALAGPVTNIALWLIGAILIVSGHITGIRTDLTDILLLTWVWGNGILALFNMLPFGPLDGRKIKSWSDTVFWIWISISAGAVYANLTVLFATRLRKPNSERCKLAPRRNGRTLIPPTK